MKAALSYLGRDWAAIAICPPNHEGVPEFHKRTCRKTGKRPLGRWKAWQTRLPTLDELVAQWEMVPAANVGIVLGPVSGLVGVDLDGPSGEEALREMSGGDLPRTLEFATGRGRRLLYAIPEGIEIISQALRGGGGEILAQGSLTVMPPSRHANGKRYRWHRRRGPTDIRPAWAPEWLWRSHSVAGNAEGQGEVGGPIPEGQRNNRLFRIACCLRRHGCTPQEILAAVRCINRRCVPPLKEVELRELARSSSRYPPAW
jgi:hypothetical protein